MSIRPTSDRAREALFSILGDRVDKAKVLDLFAGTGAMGLEAFSRNAAFVVFVDNDRFALELVKKNILLCLAGYTGNCELRVIQHDLSKGLPLKKLPAETTSGFNLIIADPPYAKNISLAVLDFLNKSMLLTEDGLLVMEERCDVTLPSRLPQLQLVDRRVYGESAFWFYIRVLSQK
jgi:16S rRNA (guanine966-N2)-methyltransferase